MDGSVRLQMPQCSVGCAREGLATRAGSYFVRVIIVP
jgi:hypothetical protein